MLSGGVDMPAPALPLVYKALGHSAAMIGGVGFLAVSFTDTITLGSVLLTLVVIAIAGIFTVRSKIANIWREEAEGERAAKDRLQEQLTAALTDRAEFEKQQQELRHELKNEIAGLKAQLKVMEAKTDLTTAVEAIREMNEHGTAVSRAIAEGLAKTAALSEDRDLKTHSLLEEIRDKLPSEPIPVHEVGSE